VPTGEAIEVANNWKSSYKKYTDQLKDGVEVTANSVHKAAEFADRHESKVADAAQNATTTIGVGVDGIGNEISSASNQASQYLHTNATTAADSIQRVIEGDPKKSGVWQQRLGKIGWGVTKVAAHTAGLGATLLRIGGGAVSLIGKAAEKIAPAVGGAAGGVFTGTPHVVSGVVDSMSITEAQIAEMQAQLFTIGVSERGRAELLLSKIKSARANNRKSVLLDLLVVGGSTLREAMRNPHDVPAQVEEAFRLAYPGLAQFESFSDAIDRMSSDELVGLASGVKGKLFELQFVDHLNEGVLPDGYHAELAHSANQPGWDIYVLDEQGHVDELIQAKATESVQYVQDALERYPDIDVTTTTEVHAHLLALGLAERVSDSGISDAALQAKIEAAAHSSAAFHANDLVPSSVGLAVIALSVFMDRGASLREMGTQFGSRSTKAVLSGAIGKAALVATQMWWVALIAGVGTRILVSNGQRKRERYQALKTALETLKKSDGTQSGFAPA